MRRIFKLTLSVITFLLLLNMNARSQTCAPTGINGTVVSLSCAQTCTDMLFHMPHLKSTSSYALNTIPYNPLAYVVATGGTEDPTLYADDQFSNVFNLPFQFCFYDSVFTKAVVGSNGCITFDTTNAACAAEGYQVTSPMPYNGGTQCVQGSCYYPKSCINGFFSDIDPDILQGPSDRKIQWRVEGTAPCRKFVVSYFHCGTFFDACLPVTDPANLNTFQMVLYESTGLIDVYIENKSCNSTTNNGTAVLGIQNWQQNQAVVAPGKNNTVWAAHNEGYRFTPNGGASRFVSCGLYMLDGTFVATADTSTTTIGVLDIAFPNICPAATTTYVIKTIFSACPTNVDLTSYDTVTIVHINNLLGATSMTPTCGASATVGTITATVTGGTGTPPFTYTLNPGGVTNNTGVFTGLGAGTYTIDITDVVSCPVTLTETVTVVTTLAGTASTTPTACTGVNNGTITLSPEGLAPFTFTLTGPGGPYTQSNPVFTNLTSGTYNVTYINGVGCTGAISNIIVNSGGTLTANTTPTQTSCAGASDGTITVAPTVAGSYTFTLNPGAITNTTGIFNGLAGGSYTITFTNTVTLCSGTAPATVNVGVSIPGTWCHFPSPTCVGHNETCPGANDGVIVITPNIAGSYTFTLTPAPGVGTASNTTGIFAGISPGVFYNVSFVNASGCGGNMTTLFVQAATALNATPAHTDVTCPGANDGTVTITPAPAGTYNYTLNPGGYTSTTGIFTGLPANTYTAVMSTLAGSCSFTVNNIVVSQGAGLVGTPTPTATSCQGANDGGITIAPPIAGTYSYTITPAPVSGPATNTTGIFSNLAAGTYSVAFSNAAGCSGTVPNIVVVAGAAITGSPAPTATSCLGANNGGVTITPGIAGSYSYTITPAPVSGPATNTTGIFSNLAAGTYSVSFSNVAGCSVTVPNFVVAAGAALTAGQAPTATSCQGATNGGVTITPSIAAAYTYTITPAPVSGPATNTTGIFSNLADNTYSVTFTNAVGCSGTNGNIIVLPGAALAANAPLITATSCQGATDGAITITPTVAAAYTFVITPAPVSGPATNTTGIYTNLAAGTYSVTFSNAAGCSGTVANIAVNPGPSLAANPPLITATSCQGANNGAITITPTIAGSHTFVITPAPVSGPATNTTGIYTNLAAGTYSVTFSNTTGCAGTVANIVVNPGPALAANAPLITPTSCQGAGDGSVNITPTIAGAYTFVITPAPITGPATNTTGLFPNLAAGTYAITFTNASGCSGTVPAIIVNAGPTLTASTLPVNTTCPGVNDGVITVTALMPGSYTFTITPAPVSGPATNTTGIFTNLAPNSYSVTMSNAATCSSTFNNIVVNAGVAPIGAASPTATSCPTVNDGTITVSIPAGNGGPYSFTISGPSGTFTQSGPTSTTFTNLSPGSYTATFISAGGCTNAVAVDPVVATGPYLSSTFTTFNPPCSYANDGTITIIPGASSVAPYAVVLTGPGGPYNQNSATPIFSNLAAGVYNYSFTDANGCTGTGGPVTLTTHAPLAVDVVLTMPLCYGNADGIITLNASGGLATYQYALSPFTTYQGGTFSGLTQGIYTFRVKDAAGCTKDTTVTLNQPTLLTATAVTAAGTCNGSDGQILVTGHDGTPVYTYSTDGINFQPASSFVVSGASAPGAIFANITVKDNNGCLATAPTVYVGLVDNMAPLVIGNDSTICAEQHVTFQPQVSPQATIFTWSTIPDPSAVSTLDNSTILNATSTPLDTTSYVLNAQWGVCSRIDTIKISVLHKPIPNAGQDTAVCFDKTIAILHGSASNLSGTVNYEWSDTTNLATPHNAVTVANPHATETFVLTVTDNYGCNFSVTDEVVVIVQPPVPAFAGNDTIAVIGEPHQLYATGGVSYTWLPANDLNFSNIPNPLATLNHDQLFQVTVTDAAGCVGYDRVYVQVYPGPGFQVPNAFTPNGDGLNDIFRVIPVGISYTEWFRIFNRYGQLVFETNQFLKGWDGTFQGKKQPIGNYVWVLKGRDKNNKVVEMKGTVLIVQ